MFSRKISSVRSRLQVVGHLIRREMNKVTVYPASSTLSGPTNKQQDLTKCTLTTKASNSSSSSNNNNSNKSDNDKPIDKNKKIVVPFEDLVFFPKGRPLAHQRTREAIDAENAAFDETVEELTHVETNEQTIRHSISVKKINSMRNTIRYLERSGLKMSKVEELSIIHVSGTKGKGSTCALTESILRHHGARTGFFSSPHLVSTNERIRINGNPVSKDIFTKHFWRVYNRLKKTREYENDMPPFFMFLTVLAFHVFVSEKVDVLVMEVGMGGELDCTNIVRNVGTVGITSLGLEHTDLLGTTLESIAWQKAGIIKAGSHVYTQVTQPECLAVIHERAAERHAAKLVEVTKSETYADYKRYSDWLDSTNDYIRLNGLLAVHLATDWLRRTPTRFRVDCDLVMSPLVIKGMLNTHWPGRCQLVEFNNWRVHLDGAHTLESMQICCDWFQNSVKFTQQNPKIMLFHRIGDSDPTPLLQLLFDACEFDMICFVPNIALDYRKDPNQSTKYRTVDIQMERCGQIQAIWQRMIDVNDRNPPAEIYNSCWNALSVVRMRYPETVYLDILVTGSLHLLGAAITALNEYDTMPSPKRKISESEGAGDNGKGK